MEVTFRGGPLEGRSIDLERADMKQEETIYWAPRGAAYRERERPGVKGVVEYLYRGEGVADYVAGTEEVQMEDVWEERGGPVRSEEDPSTDPASDAEAEEARRCPVCGVGLLRDLSFVAGGDKRAEQDLQEPDSMQAELYTCGHEVLGPRLDSADADALDVERRSSEDVVDPGPAA
jgi:hypothetical protein